MAIEIQDPILYDRNNHQSYSIGRNMFKIIYIINIVALTNLQIFKILIQTTFLRIDWEFWGGS